MKRVIVGLIVTFAVSVLSLGFWSPAQASPDAPSAEQTAWVDGAARSSTQGAASASDPADMPRTGASNAVLLGGGTTLVLAGGVVVFVAARRQTS